MSADGLCDKKKKKVSYIDEVGKTLLWLTAIRMSIFGAINTI